MKLSFGFLLFIILITAALVVAQDDSELPEECQPEALAATLEDYAQMLREEEASLTEVVAELTALEENCGGEAEALTFYTTGSANLRACSNTSASCRVVESLIRGYELSVIGEEDGAVVSGSPLWYIVDFDGQELYIHSSLVSENPPAPVSSNNNNNNNPPVATSSGNASAAPTLMSTPIPQPSYTCGGDQYNCGDFTNRNDLMAYFNACPGDPSKLDGNNDGVPCESVR